jgi:hypothetical protein
MGIIKTQVYITAVIKGKVTLPLPVPSPVEKGGGGEHLVKNRGLS